MFRKAEPPVFCVPADLRSVYREVCIVGSWLYIS